jgi:integrase
MKIDLYKTDETLKTSITRLENLDLPQRNKELILEFIDCSLVGWNGVKLGKKRAIKYLYTLKEIALHLEDREFEYIDKADIRRLLRTIDADPAKGEWTQHDYRVILRRFVTWLREEHGYPEDYPDRQDHVKALEMLKLGVTKHALEVSKVRVKRPDKLRERSTIPSKEQVQYLREAAIHPRDKAFFAVMEELGPRPGGICSRQLKHVEFDEIGARIYLHDKTMRGEPVRITWSAGFLRVWVESHPFRDDPESPLWINLHKTAQGAVPLDYPAFTAIMKRARTRHNKTAKARGLPLLPPMDLYAFRYYAQIRDELAGVPRSVQIRQRGWRYDSDMPDRYARLVSGDVDSYYKKSLGIDDDEVDDRPVPCPRCRGINHPDVLFCKRCGLPFTEEGMKHKDTVTRLAMEVLKDPELREELLKALG